MIVLSGAGPRASRAHSSVAAAAVSAAATLVLFGLIGSLRRDADSPPAPELLIRPADVTVPRRVEERRPPSHPRADNNRKPRREPVRQRISVRLAETRVAPPRQSLDPMRRFLVRADLAAPVRTCL
ncbi:MAG: hypothetical protein N3A38_03590, partial [Planctomycetota bacterium]|nr:hypothetical protein [Planctomycetota bacterium]